MKHILQHTSILIAFICISLVALPKQSNSQSRQNLTYRQFYDDLSPYGQWIDDPSYGYVWSPNAGANFRPYYSSGHWVMTDYGNMWASDYSWGWAPFHYGRWTYDSFYGWLWIPDSEWGPSWVSWRYSNDYYGWAPMGPGISISMSYGNYYPPENWWVFIPPMYIHHSNWHNHHHNEHGNHNMIQHTNFMDNTYTNNNHSYVSGPRSEQIQHFTHQAPRVYRVQDNPRQGKPTIQNNQVNVYRPNISGDDKSKGPSKAVKSERTIGAAQPINTSGKPTRTNRNEVSPKQNQVNMSKPNQEIKQDKPAVDRRQDAPPLQSKSPDKRNEQPIDRTPQPQNRLDQTPPNRNQETPVPRNNQPQERDQPQQRNQPQQREQPQAQPVQSPQQSQPQQNREAPRSNPPQQRSAPAQQTPRTQSPRQGQQNNKSNGRRSATKKMKKRTQY